MTKQFYAHLNLKELIFVFSIPPVNSSVVKGTGIKELFIVMWWVEVRICLDMLGAP